MHNHFDAVIIGGGVIGNASALSLSQLGFRVALLSDEKPATLSKNSFDTRIYALSHSSVQLLEDLRIWDALDISRICAVRDMRIMGDAEHGKMQQGVLTFNAYSTYQVELAWIIEQSNIQSALLQAIQFSPNITIISDRAIALQINDDSVRIQTNSGQEISADLLIGSDGSNSWVRQTLQIGTDKFDYAQNGIVANFTCDLPHHECAHQWFLAHGEVLALLPLPEQQVSMVYSCSSDKVDGLLQLDSKTLAQYISELSHYSLGELHVDSNNTMSAQAFPLQRMRAHRFIANRVVIIGDAAHTVHPMAGQGLNLGLQDLTCLRRLIMQRESFRNIYDTVLLRRYERERMAATVQMQSVTHALNRMFSHDHPIARHARNLGMNLLDITPPLKRWLVKSAMGRNNT